MYHIVWPYLKKGINDVFYYFGGCDDDVTLLLHFLGHNINYGPMGNYSTLAMLSNNPYCDFEKPLFLDYFVYLCHQYDWTLSLLARGVNPNTALDFAYSHSQKYVSSSKLPQFLQVGSVINLFKRKREIADDVDAIDNVDSSFEELFKSPINLDFTKVDTSGYTAFCYAIAHEVEAGFPELSLAPIAMIEKELKVQALQTWRTGGNGSDVQAFVNNFLNARTIHSFPSDASWRPEWSVLAQTRVVNLAEELIKEIKSLNSSSNSHLERKEILKEIAQGNRWFVQRAIMQDDENISSEEAIKTAIAHNQLGVFSQLLNQCNYTDEFLKGILHYTLSMKPKLYPFDEQNDDGASYFDTVVARKENCSAHETFNEFGQIGVVRLLLENPFLLSAISVEDLIRYARTRADDNIYSYFFKAMRTAFSLKLLLELEKETSIDESELEQLKQSLRYQPQVVSMDVDSHPASVNGHDSKDAKNSMDDDSSMSTERDSKDAKVSSNNSVSEMRSKGREFFQAKRKTQQTMRDADDSRADSKSLVAVGAQTSTVSKRSAVGSTKFISFCMASNPAVLVERYVAEAFPSEHSEPYRKYLVDGLLPYVLNLKCAITFLKSGGNLLPQDITLKILSEFLGDMFSPVCRPEIIANDLANLMFFKPGSYGATVLATKQRRINEPVFSSSSSSNSNSSSSSSSSSSSVNWRP